ncbi:MAG: zf-TFIIB domain-containing protein [Sulfurisoma sp.]|nr:zf-TFIIB domain-containing protein [Sulfurisoma sp.]
MTATRCPSCRAAMTPLSLPGKLHGTVELDLCFSCQGIWFDQWESHQIAPGGIVELFKLIHEHRDDLRMPLADPLRCPRCDEKLPRGLDVTKSGKFAYHRCLQGHGRFTVFAQFMIEKGFVRQLSPLEIKALAARIQVVHCTGCGAPVDIRKDAACTHCRAPIAILDPAAVEQALATYHHAEVKRTERDPNALAEAILMTERQRSQRQRETTNPLERPVGDLVVSGVEIVWGMLKR